MRLFFYLVFFFPLFCLAQLPDPDEEIMEYMQLHANDDTASMAIGTVGNGSLTHGKLMPYSGPNFRYFDRQSYLAGRAFTHSSTKETILATYDSLYCIVPERIFRFMECSNKEGGELFPHKTHQNGLSIDLMMPLIKNQLPYYDLDNVGAQHYALSFDDEGRLKDDSLVSIDFNLVALQILLIDHFAKQFGLNINKVIIKIELKDELYATEYGQLLKSRGIYVVQGLDPVINDLHDDHFHLDFSFPVPLTEPAQRHKK